MKYITRIVFGAFFIMIFFLIQVYAFAIPEIVGQSGITIDVDTGEMIYTKNIDSSLYPASTTKLMTAIILAENNKPEDLFTYSKDAKAQEPFTISFNVKNIDVDNKITAYDAMDAMLIPSANDIAYMIAENVGAYMIAENVGAYMIAENVGGGGYKVFIDLMNKKVQSLNLKNTHFVTANGLHDPNHYSTAYDLSVIAREASKYPWIMGSLSKKQGQIKTQNGVVATFQTKNKLLSEKGNIGGKTGYTSEAGRCLVSYFEIDGRKLVGVVLKSDYDTADKTVFEDMKKIINWSYTAEKEIFIKANTEVKKISEKYSLLPYNLGPIKSTDISLHTKVDIKRYVSSDIYNTTYSVSNIDPWKLDKDVAIGSVTITSRETKNTYPLYPSISRRDLINSNSKFYIIAFVIAPIFILISILLIILIEKNKRNRKKYKRMIRW